MGILDTAQININERKANIKFFPLADAFIAMKILGLGSCDKGTWLNKSSTSQVRNNPFSSPS